MAYSAISFTFGEQPSAAKWNILGSNDSSFNDGTGIASDAIHPNHLTTGLSSTTWAWQSWTPTLSGQFTDGDWTKASKYIQIGKTVFFHLYLTAADATPMAGGTGQATFTLPVTSASLGGANIPSIGTGLIKDAGSSSYPAVCTWQTTTTVDIAVQAAGGTYLTTANISATVPMTWTTSDVISIVGFYEAAA